MRRVTFLAPLMVFTAGIYAGGAAFAQTIPTADIEAAAQEAQRQQAAQQEATAARRAAQRGQGTSGPSVTSAADPFAPALGGPCFAIREVTLHGTDAFGAEPDGYQALIGRCVTAAEIGAALNGINQHYQDQGYITTRAYVPEQDVADGSLEITVIAGRIEGYVYKDGSIADRRLHSAFPTGRGDLLSLRDLEQGLDNINGPKSANGQFQMIPGEAPGGSFVQVGIDDDRSWHFDLSVNNTGFDTTGVAKATASLGFDNVFGLNDQLSFGLTTTPFDARNKRLSDSWSVSWDVPVGNWSYGVDAGVSDYFFILPGINQSYPVEGRSDYVTFSAERLLMRNQSAKVYAYGDLKLTRTRTFIDHAEIESQRRNLTIASFGLRGERSFERGKLTWDLGVKHGLDLFNSYVLDKSIVDPEFRVLKARLSYEHKIGDNGALYRGVLGAQHATDILPGSEQFSIGSWSTVRGFHDDGMYGDTGVYLQNTFEWDAHKDDYIDVRMKLGLDVGYVEPSELRRWDQNYLVGLSIGADVTFNNDAVLTLQVAHALSRPDENPPNAQPAFEANRTVGYIGLKMEF